jgi:hypothetical protein
VTDAITDAPDAPDARVLALDIGLYGHRGATSSMFWYHDGGVLHAHTATLLPDEATLGDQLDYLEALAEAYPEYWRISPVVVIGVTVLSPVGRREVRTHLDRWYNPPWRRRLVQIGDYAGEQTGAGRGLVSRKKLRDLLAARLGEHTITLTATQYDAVAQYTGRRVKPGRDADDEWRTDDTDALALPVALSCLGAAVLLPPAAPTAAARARAVERAARAWQIELGLDPAQALDRAQRLGHPRAQGTAQPAVLPRPGPGARPIPGPLSTRGR